MTDHPDMTALSTYLDGELDRAQTAQISRHLAGCIQCQELYRDMQALSLDLQALSRDAPPVNLAARLNGLSASPQPLLVRHAWRQRLHMSFGAAASLALGLFLGSALQPDNPTLKTSETSILAVLGAAPPGALCARPELCFLKVDLQ